MDRNRSGLRSSGQDAEGSEIKLWLEGSTASTMQPGARRLAHVWSLGGKFGAGIRPSARARLRAVLRRVDNQTMLARALHAVHSLTLSLSRWQFSAAFLVPTVIKSMLVTYPSTEERSMRVSKVLGDEKSHLGGQYTVHILAVS